MILTQYYNIFMILYLFVGSCFLHIYAYDESVSKKCVYLSNLAYCNTTYCDSCTIDFIVENFDSKAIQGYDYFTNSIFTSFRGSSNIHNWMENMQIQHIEPYENNSIRIDAGFYKNYMYIKEQIFENLYILTDKYNTSDLLLTGHSLGSAACTLMAYDVACETKFKISYFYNFGSPRVGNNVFVEDFNKKIEGFRVVHNNDIVSSLPPMIFDYAHMSECIHYNENNDNYKECEDELCNITECSISDHLNYLNISMGC